MTSIDYQIPNLFFKEEPTTIVYHYTECTALERTTPEESEIEDCDDNLQSSVSKDRILTYFRNELLIVQVTDIAFIYIENSITYVVTLDGRKSTSSHSLDNLITELDEHSFFRVNRQIIIGVSAINKIIKIGQGLKVVTQPTSENPIFVGKNKSLRFKKWLNG